jgi:hypothetical protein
LWPTPNTPEGKEGWRLQAGRNTDLKKPAKLAKEQDGFGRKIIPFIVRLTFGAYASVKGQSALFADAIGHASSNTTSHHGTP